jgi:hypothetical protein
MDSAEDLWSMLPLPFSILRLPLSLQILWTICCKYIANMFSRFPPPLVPGAVRSRNINQHNTAAVAKFKRWQRGESLE